MNAEINPQSIEVSAASASGEVIITPQTVSVKANADTLAITLENPVIRELVGGEPYEGDYNMTPTTSVQTLPTNGKLLARDVTVGAIPNNYGLITWSGSVLTVS